MDLGALAGSDLYALTATGRRLGNPLVYLEPWEDEASDDAALRLAFSIVGIYLQRPILGTLSDQ